MAKDTAPEAKIAQLSEMQRYVTQHRGTEPPFTGALLHNKQEGIYHCLVCNAPLFLSKPSMTPAAAGRAFTSRITMKLSAIWKMTRTVCTASKSAAVTATPIWATSSRMARSQPVSAIVSTQRR